MNKDTKELAVLRRWLRTHDPEYLQKRKEYNEKEKVKERRKKNNKRRRLTSCALLHLVKKSKNCSIDGKNYQIRNGRLITEEDDACYVVRVDRKGNVYKIEVETDSDIEDEKFDMDLDETKSHLVEQIKKLFDGDEELEKAVSRKSVKKVEEIPREELFWKKMDDEEKNKLLLSLNK